MDIETLNNWNPWWNTKEVPKALVGRTRTFNPAILKVLKEKEIIALTGIRRSGKTTLMYQMVASLVRTVDAKKILYVNLDDELLKKERLESIYTCYRQHMNPDKPAFVFLDEIQNSDGWEHFLKKYYDLHEPVKFIISGSSAHLLRGEFSTLLTGRNITFVIYPLSFSEFLAFSGVDTHIITSQTKSKIINALYRYLEYGGFPEVYFKDDDIKSLLLKQYFDDIIYKDIVKRHDINAKKITDLAVYLLTNISNPTTIRKIRNFTGLSIDSIKDYISYLEDAHIFLPLQHFSYSLIEKAQIPLKSYVIDCGLRNIVGFRFSSDRGRLAENCVRTELERRELDASYWKGKGEVDFVIKNKDNSLTAMNVCFADAVNEREIQSLQEFAAKFKKTTQSIVLSRDVEEKRGDITIIPLWKWLMET